jgi:hypothetical protein
MILLLTIKDILYYSKVKLWLYNQAVHTHWDIIVEEFIKTFILRDTELTVFTNRLSVDQEIINAIN